MTIEEQADEPQLRECGAKILMVDDHAANLVALEAVLQPLGHHLLKAQSAEEALKHLLKEEVALILMDVQMPMIDGFKAAALIKARERTRHVPIIFLTAISKDASYIFQGYECGAVDYILKPFDPAILRSKVSVFIELFQQRAQIKQQSLLIQKREREELKRTAEVRYRNLSDAMPLCMWATQADGEIVYSNRAWREYSGLSSEQILTEGYFHIVHSGDRDAYKRAWQQALSEVVALKHDCRLRSAADDVFRWHTICAVPEFNEKSEHIGFIVTAADIDAQKRAQEEAETANRLKDEFLAIVSHELRTPLNAIIGWVQLIQSGKLHQSKFRNAMEVINRNAKAQAQLIEDILDVSRIITGNLRLSLGEVSLSSVILNAVDSLRPTIDANGVDLNLSLDPTFDIVVGDGDRLRQVIWNLLSNALKFTPRTGKIGITLRGIQDQVEIQVSDTGNGIDPAFLPYVFDRFRQADSSCSRTSGGLGLGLAIVRNVTDLHGGTVEITSPGENQGTTVTLRLPAHSKAVHPEIQIESISAPASTALNGLRILFVDDEMDARSLIRELLADCGAEVVEACSAAEGLSVLKESKPDVLVSDIGMPREDGYSFLQKVRALDPQHGGKTPAIALSGFASDEDRRRALAAGFQHHLPKPVDQRKLVALVASLGGRAA